MIFILDFFQCLIASYNELYEQDFQKNVGIPYRFRGPIYGIAIKILQISREGVANGEGFGRKVRKRAPRNIKKPCTRHKKENMYSKVWFLQNHQWR